MRMEKRETLYMGGESCLFFLYALHNIHKFKIQQIHIVSFKGQTFLNTNFLCLRDLNMRFYKGVELF